VDATAGFTNGRAWAAAVAAVLGAHRPSDAREARSRQCTLAALAALERPWDRSASPVHVTASAIVCGPRGVVLHRHRRLGRWLQPGGHVDDGEPPARAAVREACEETGLVVRHPSGGPLLLHVDVHEAAEGHRHLDLRYLLVGEGAEPSPPPGESPDARWFSWEEAAALADESLAGALRAARRAREQLGAPGAPDERGDGTGQGGTGGG